MNNTNSDIEKITQKLRKAKLKITPQRLAILKELINNYKHPTADTIYQTIKQQLPNISFDTVNRTLITFAQNNVIKIAEGRGRAKRYDPITQPHHHFYCVKCDKIFDFASEKYDKIKIPKDITRKYQVFSQKIVLDGICKDCIKNEDYK